MKIFDIGHGKEAEQEVPDLVPFRARLVGDAAIGVAIGLASEEASAKQRIKGSNFFMTAFMPPVLAGEPKETIKEPEMEHMYVGSPKDAIDLTREPDFDEHLFTAMAADKKEAEIAGLEQMLDSPSANPSNMPVNHPDAQLSDQDLQVLEAQRAVREALPSVSQAPRELTDASA